MQKLLLLLSIAFLFSCKNAKESKEANDETATEEPTDMPKGWTEEQKEEFTDGVYKEMKDPKYQDASVKKFAACVYEGISQELTYKEVLKIKKANEEGTELPDALQKKGKALKKTAEDCENLLKKKTTDEEETSRTNNNNSEENNAVDYSDSPLSSWTAKERNEGVETTQKDAVAKGYTVQSSWKYAYCYVYGISTKITYSQFNDPNPDAKVMRIANEGVEKCKNLLVPATR